MTDIVNKLRNLIGNCKCIACQDRKEAADEIDQLRATIQNLTVAGDAMAELLERFILLDSNAHLLAWKEARRD